MMPPASTTKKQLFVASDADIEHVYPHRLMELARSAGAEVHAVSGATHLDRADATTALVIAPCDLATVAAIARGDRNRPIEQLAAAILDGHGRVVLVIAESPLSAASLDDLLVVTRRGAVVCPAAPAFYQKPRSVDDLLTFIAMRILDQVDIRLAEDRRWDGRMD